MVPYRMFPKAITLYQHESRPRHRRDEVRRYIHEVLRKEEICPLSTLSRLHDGCFGLELQTLGVWSLTNTVSQREKRDNPDVQHDGRDLLPVSVPLVLRSTAGHPSERADIGSVRRVLRCVRCAAPWEVTPPPYPPRALFARSPDTDRKPPLLSHRRAKPSRFCTLKLWGAPG